MSALLLGARQVGKSTLVAELSPTLTIDLADEGEFYRYARDRELLQRQVKALEGPQLIAVDEIQRVPELLNTVQSLIDHSSKRIRFVLTGSSARKLHRKGANLLPGRVVVEYCDPLTFLEMGTSFSLDRVLQIGSLPGIYSNASEGLALLESYTATYLREEIRTESLVRNIGAFSRFLDVAAQSSGQWINYSKLASDVEIPKETLRRFYDVLVDTLVAHRIEPFQMNASKRRISQRDRILLFDVGVRNAILQQHQRPPSLEVRGSLFEQWMILQLIAINRALKKGWKLTSYRTDAGAEVDVVIETVDAIIGIEIKYGTSVNRSDTRGLHSLGEVLPKKRRYFQYLLYRGNTRQAFDSGAVALNYLDGLRELIERY